MDCVEKIITNVRQLLPKNKFARGVSVLVGGTAGSQLLMVLASPFLTRLYTPEDFGLLAVYAGLLSVCTVIACLRYEIAIPLPERDQEAANVVALCLIVLTVMTALSSVVILFAGKWIAKALRTPLLAKFFWLLPLGIFFAGIYQIFNLWTLRTKQFSNIASTKIKQSITMIALQLLGSKFGAISLLAGQAAGHSAGGLTLGKLALSRPEFRTLNFQSIVFTIKRYRHFPMFSTAASLLNTAGSQLPPILFAALFNPAAAGLYTLADRVLGTPLSVLGAATGNVFFSNAAEAYRDGRLGLLVASVHEKLAHIAMPLMIIMVVAAPELFAFIFGEPWRQAGVLARLMVPWLYMVFITSPFSSIFSIMELQHRDVIFQILLVIIRTLAIVVGSFYQSLFLTVALFSAGSTLCWIAFLIWMSLSSGNAWYAIITPTVKSFLWGLLVVLPLLVAMCLTDNIYIKALFFILTLILATTRYIFLYRTHNKAI